MCRRRYWPNQQRNNDNDAFGDVTDWQKDFGVPPTMIKGGVAGSGMFDLKPVRLSARSNYIKFTDEAEETLSA
ncbi:MAG: hypothetical protein WCE27_13070, partial [Pseudolabrys sp.]